MVVLHRNIARISFPTVVDTHLERGTIRYKVQFKTSRIRVHFFHRGDPIPTQKRCTQGRKVKTNRIVVDPAVRENEFTQKVKIAFSKKFNCKMSDIGVEMEKPVPFWKA